MCDDFPGMPRNDLSLYDRHAGDWWDTESHAFRSLHSVQQFRVERLLGALGRRGVAVSGARVLDLGCGGGIVAARFGAAGAEVVGLDRSRQSLLAAAAGARPRPRLLVQGDAARAPFFPRTFDLVLLADLLEHVPDPAAVMRCAAELVRKDGYIYTSTLNRTLRGRVLAVHVAEGLGLVPRGTHDPRMFVRPRELEVAGREAGLELVEHTGEGVALLATVRRWRVVPKPSRSLAVAYQSLFKKREVGV